MVFSLRRTARRNDASVEIPHFVNSWLNDHVLARTLLRSEIPLRTTFSELLLTLSPLRLITSSTQRQLLLCQMGSETKSAEN